MQIKFNGKEESEKIISSLKIYINKNNINKNVVAILVGDDEASKIYTNLKQKAAEKIGINMQIEKFDKNISYQELKEYLNNLNKDKNIDGIMIQLPLPSSLIDKTSDLINLINKTKDIDGMREDSDYISATAKAVLKIFNTAKSKDLINSDSKTAIIGYKGQVGSRLVKLFKKYYLINLDIGDDLVELKNADVIISATGEAGLIKSEFIKKGSVLIDVGAPKPEFSEDCYQKAGFYTPVPGGVGPMTVASLMENIVKGPAE